MKHEKSDKLFYENQLKAMGTGSGFRAFIWIDRKQPGGGHVQRETLSLRSSGDIEIHPGHEVCQTVFARLDPRFEQVAL